MNTAAVRAIFNRPSSSTCISTWAYYQHCWCLRKNLSRALTFISVIIVPVLLRVQRLMTWCVRGISGTHGHPEMAG